MPTYAYRCPKCGHEFQKFRKMTVKARPKCPECGTTAVSKITGGVGLHFKGSGFYITDYKAGQKGQGGQEGQKPAAESKAETKKTDAKPKKGTDA
jgi:putative FmdB family regulatory protein